jgi:molybdenum cofactor cytidylyltransferase
MSQVAAIVLAAGGSTRMGQPKQLLPWRGRSLLRHTVDVAQEAGCAPLIVVLGAASNRLRLELAGMNVTLVDNPDWEQGPGTSIRAGLTALESTDAVVFLVCDQPLVDADHIRQLGKAQQATDRPMAASEYGGSIGVPALFTRDYFPALMSLTPTAGAKQLLTRHSDLVATVPFPAGEFDIDTPADYERLTSE